MRKLDFKNFPLLLKEIPDPPKHLYMEGKLPSDDNKFLAVVGARKYSEYGKEATEMLISGLRGFSIVIVSGLALGIDAIAHRAALGAGIKTIAIPGSGLSRKVLYPSVHHSLAENILASGGTLLSEFEPEFRATPWSFPQRNRIMAGLAHAVLVIEAEQKSGTLITSRLATEYNRDVFTVPGSIFSKNSEGPHMLLRLGATPVTNPKELLQAIGFKQDDVPAVVDFANCSPEEIKVLELIETPLAREDLVRALHISTSEANALLSIMEIKGLIRESMGEIHRA